MKGKLIVIEGLDGSGKATQTQKLCDYYRGLGKPVRQIAFPDYNDRSSALVQMYLAGEFGTLHEVNAYAGSSFYSVDRYASFTRYWKKDYELGHTIISDRYTTSNVTHHMCKLPEDEWDAYLEWLADFEYGKLGLPRPDLIIYLDVTPQVSRRLIEKRYAGDESKKDIHEADFEYLMTCRKAALYGAEKWNYQVIRCCDGEKILPIEQISRQVIDAAKEFFRGR